MVSAAGSSMTLGVALVAHARQEDDGEPIIVPAMWLVPGAVVGAAVLMLMLMARKR